VTWYEADAFCRWLNSVIGTSDQVIRLPREIEWEAAARGKTNQIYPYEGNTYQAVWANGRLTNINRTSAVGLMPEGDSPFGVSDMSGNVCKLPPAQGRMALLCPSRRYSVGREQLAFLPWLFAGMPEGCWACLHTGRHSQRPAIVLDAFDTITRRNLTIILPHLRLVWKEKGAIHLDFRPILISRLTTGVFVLFGRFSEPAAMFAC
jgi:hypothetical protein